MPRAASPKPKKSILAGYKTYDPSVEGFGDASQWRDEFRTRMGIDEAQACLGSDDPLVVLGVSARSTWKEMKTAFRKLALKFHPDYNSSPEATSQMQRINAAYVILEKRYGQ